MPLLSLVDSAIVYALNQIVVTLGEVQISNGHAATGLPEYAIIAATLGIMILMMTLLGYFEDFADGIIFPRQAAIYAVGCLIGLAYFSGAIGNVSLGGIGSDAIISSIASLVILAIGVGVRFWLDSM